MDINQFFNPAIIRNHPAAVAMRRANERRAAKTLQENFPEVNTTALTPCLTERDFLYSECLAAWLNRYPSYPLSDTLVAHYGCIHLWQLSTAQLREFLTAIK